LKLYTVVEEQIKTSNKNVVHLFSCLIKKFTAWGHYVKSQIVITIIAN